MRRFRDPPPLAADAPPFSCPEAEAFYGGEKANAELKMALYDRQPPVVRRVDWAVGHVNIARSLVQKGCRTAEQAEPIVRRMLARLP